MFHIAAIQRLYGIALSKAPIAIAHRNCLALNSRLRTKTAEAIDACTAKGGVIGITGVRMAVSGKEPTALGNMVEHIDYVVKPVGIDHVGLGSAVDSARRQEASVRPRLQSQFDVRCRERGFSRSY